MFFFYVYVYEYSLGRAFRNFNKPAVCVCEKSCFKCGTISGLLTRDFGVAESLTCSADYLVKVVVNQTCYYSV